MPYPKKGTFRLSNPKKYRGDPNNITYRSSWELSMMMRLDHNPNVLEWSSEEVKVPYRSLLDEAYESKHRMDKKRYHWYFIDFYVKVRKTDGNTDKYLIEVKPKHETVKPERAKFRSDRKFKESMSRWIINRAKWKAASEYARDHGMSFKIYTEENIYGHR